MGLREMGLPERIGRYELVAELASGGMAEILLARFVGPNGFERPVVIKRILPHLAREKAFVDMFLDEARIVAGILHPNVVQVQELGHEGTEVFLAMEYLEGESVSGLTKRLVAADVRIDAALACSIIAQACAGLHAAHELKDAGGYPLNLVHRDISPQNIFVTYAGQVKVLDFGVAKAADRITRTETGVLKGKHEYMSPEQCVGKPLDRRSDVFSMGVVLYEILAGKRLFKRDNQMASLHAICNETIPTLSQTASWVDPRVDAPVMRALSRDRRDRFESAAEMRRELLAVAHALAPGMDFEEALGALMSRHFEARIEAKQEMLRRVRSGSAVTHVPRGEVDLSVDIPIVTEAAPGPGNMTTASRWETRVDPARVEAPRRSRAWVAFAAAGAAAVALGVWSYGRSPAATPVARVPPPPSATAAPPAPETAPAAPPPAASVVVHVETNPPGASVTMNGKDVGATPLDLFVPRGSSSLAMEVRRPGYATLTQSVVPTEDQRLVLALSPTPFAGARRPTPEAAKRAPPVEAHPASAPPPPAPTATESGFRRYD